MNKDDRINNLLDSTNRGESAAQVLENSEFINGFDTIIDEITFELSTIDTSNESKMRSVITKYQVARKFKSRLTALVENGQRDQSTLSTLLNKLKAK